MLLTLTLTAALNAAQQESTDPTFLDTASAGQDYAVQGEYKNDWGGSQIIALGNGHFRMVTFQGGLPGAGWDNEFRQDTAGLREAGKVVFSGPNQYRAELSGGAITITTR